MEIGYLTCEDTSHGSIALSSNDSELFLMLSSIYALEARCHIGDGRRIKILKEEQGYTVYDGNALAGFTTRREIALGIVDAIIDFEYRSWAQGELCTLHSFGVASHGGAVALLGTSGSGKTTLGIACVAHGFSFMGDEYGFLNLENARYWHARYPISIRHGTERAVGMPMPRGAAIVTSQGAESQLVSVKGLLECLNALDSSTSTVPLHAIALLNRDANHTEPTARRIPVSVWPDTVMLSIEGCNTRMELYERLIKVVAAQSIDVLELRYSDCTQAARWMSKAMNKKGRLVNHV